MCKRLLRRELMIKDLRDFPRIKCNIAAHIFYEQHIYSGTIIDLSCWGAKIKSKNKLEELEFLRVSFVFNREFSILADIVENLGNDEYRIKFTFKNIADKYGLKYAIESHISK
jgi:hypothetical protein